MARYEAVRGSGFFEIERDGCVVRTCKGERDKFRRKEKEYATEDDARYWAARAVTINTWGMKVVGPSRILAAKAEEPVGSTLLADEYFAAADNRFVPELLRVRAGGNLAARTEPWYTDPRPWARQQLLAYILDGCDQPEHKGLVKRLYKKAEAAGDDTVIARFMVAFDQMGHRLLVTEPYDGLRANPELVGQHYKEDPRDNRFSRATRQYLARRAYRYFRRIAYRDPVRYVRCLLVALPLYRDDELATPAQLLDAWGLMQALYGDSKAIVRDPRGIRLESESSLSDLAPAPRWPDAWKAEEHFVVLVAIVATAQSRTVRGWIARWLRLHYAAQLAKLPFAMIKRLMNSPHDEVQILGAELFGKLSGLETLPISDWLDVLAIENIDVVTMVAAVVEKHVSPNRLTLEQAIALACAKTAPVARLGLQWAKAKRIGGEEDLRAISKITRAGVASVRSEGTAWATSIITGHAAAKPEHLRDLVDAPFADAREHALAAVAQKPELSPPTLWFALAESPYPDVRDVVIDNAKKWRDAAPPKTLKHVWSSAMLAVNRGSNAKRRVPRQIAERIATHPDEAAQLLPILSVALRSVRPAERAAALGALARAARENPALRALATQLIPELEITELVSA
ncbi:MAG: hypothetical protein M4D80_20405 [Myxococcota bacterium]|nr:hypothetical protein [Myxococcota bacterium]